MMRGRSVDDVHVAAVDLEDDVAGLDAGLVRRTALLDELTSAPLALRQAERLGDLLGHLLDLHADAAARHAALFLAAARRVFIATSIGIANARPM